MRISRTAAAAALPTPPGGGGRRGVEPVVALPVHQRVEGGALGGEEIFDRAVAREGDGLFFVRLRPLGQRSFPSAVRSCRQRHGVVRRPRVVHGRVRHRERPRRDRGTGFVEQD